MVEDIPGKLGLILHRLDALELSFNRKIRRHRMRLRPIRLLLGYKPTKPIIGTGCGSKSPEMDSETRVQALRGAAGAKPLPCGQP